MLKKISVSIVLLLCMMQTAWAESTVGVKILSGTQTYTHEGFTVPVTIEFVDAQLYNEDVYFSYHVLAEDGSILRYENERIPISLENGKTTIELNVQCLTIPELESVDTAEIQFDLVDQKNVYWFRNKDLIEYMGNSVLFEKDKLLTNESVDQQPLQPFEKNSTISSNPLACFLNILACVILVTVIVKSGLFRKKTQVTQNALEIKSNRLQFIGLLRAIACIMVLWSHYVCTFLVNGVDEIFTQILPKQQQTSELIKLFVLAFTDEINISIGQLGVGIFFLITGFTTIYSLSMKNPTPKGFFLSRIIRIYPVYIVGVFILYVFTMLYTH